MQTITSPKTTERAQAWPFTYRGRGFVLTVTLAHQYQGVIQGGCRTTPTWHRHQALQQVKAIIDRMEGK
jgi:hypothetical protein